MAKMFNIELKEIRITYNAVQIEASDADEAQAIASELYEADFNDSRSQLGQCGRCYVDIVSICES